MAEIAAAAGMPVGNIYRRFKSKEDIVHAIKLDATSRLESAIALKFDSRSLRTPREVVLAFGQAMGAAFQKDEALHRVLFSQPMVTPSISMAGTEARVRIFTRYKQTLTPLLANPSSRRIELAVRISFQIMALAFLARARGDDPLMATMSWAAVGKEYGEAAVLYLSTSDARTE